MDNEQRWLSSGLPLDLAAQHVRSWMAARTCGISAPGATRTSTKFESPAERNRRSATSRRTNIDRPVAIAFVSREIPSTMNRRPAGARSYALANADVVVLAHARFNWLFHFGLAPRFQEDVKGHPDRHRARRNRQ